MTAYFSEVLGTHDRLAFASGNERVDAYFHRTVTQDVKRRYAACYVLVDKASGSLAGFYTLSSYSIPIDEIADDIARKLPRYPSVPAVLLGWMGRASEFRGRQIGALLLADAIHRVVHSPVGAHALCADAIDEAAAAFYKAHQFLPLASRPSSLFLPMRTALALFPPATLARK